MATSHRPGCECAGQCVRYARLLRGLRLKGFTDLSVLGGFGQFRMSVSRA